MWFRDGGMRWRLASRFSAAVRDAREHKLDLWQSTPLGALALVLLLDQFPRILHSGDMLAYSGDNHAQQIALAVLRVGVPEHWSPAEFIFMIMPLLHAEDLYLQHRNHDLAAHLHRGSSMYKVLTSAYLAESAVCTDMVKRFGRFPTRNRALCRRSTQEEFDFLAQRLPRRTQSVISISGEA